MTKPSPVIEFPLTRKTAKNIINTIASEHTQYVRFSRHAKERMQQRSITNKQILQVLSCSHSRFTESPALTARGSHKATIQGIAAGDRIDIVVDIRRHDEDPSLYIVTVFLSK